MICFRDYFFLKEDPDQVWGPSEYSPNDHVQLAHFTDTDAIPFGHFHNHVVYSLVGQTHYDIQITLYNYTFHNDEAYLRRQIDFFPKIHDLGFVKQKVLMTTEKYGDIRDNPQKIIPKAGRLWTEPKIISFWYTKKQIGNKHLQLYINFLKHLKQNPEEYKFQFVNSEKLIPYDKLGNVVKSTRTQAEIDARYQEHIKSPLEKQKPKEAPYQMPLSVPGQPGKKWWAMSSESNNRSKQ